MIYGNRIEDLRDEFEIKQRELADYLGISRSLLGRYENEYAIIPIKHLNSIANYFNVSLDYIFNFTDKRNYINFKKDIDKIEVGKRLKEFRKSHKLTQVLLAEELNTVHPVIVNYEKGKNLISTSFLYILCKKYKISADYLLGRIDKKPF